MHSRTTFPSAGILPDEEISDQRAESLQELWQSLHLLCSAWRSQSSRLAAEFGLSSPQFTVLTTLSAGEPMTMGQIGEQSDLPTSSLTALVDRLAELGLVSRGAHPSDRRAIQVRLTERGRDLAGLVASETILATAHLTASLADYQLDAASGAIRQLTDSFQRYVATPRRAPGRPIARRSGVGRSARPDHATPRRLDGKARHNGTANQDSTDALDSADHRDGTAHHDGATRGASRHPPEQAPNS